MCLKHPHVVYESCPSSNSIVPIGRTLGDVQKIDTKELDLNTEAIESICEFKTKHLNKDGDMIYPTSKKAVR